jgi:hypothetical protein
MRKHIGFFNSFFFLYKLILKTYKLELFQFRWHVVGEVEV